MHRTRLRQCRDVMDQRVAVGLRGAIHARDEAELTQRERTAIVVEPRIRHYGFLWRVGLVTCLPELRVAAPQELEQRVPAGQLLQRVPPQRPAQQALALVPL